MSVASISVACLAAGTRSATGFGGLTSFEVGTLGKSPSEIDGHWWVAQVYPRHEKSTAAALERRGVACYLPLIEDWRIERKQRRRVELPLFSGYLFVACADHRDFNALHEHDSIYGLIRVVNQTKFRKQLNIIHAANASGELHRVHTIPVGTTCRITAGHPLEGQEGPLITVDGRHRFVLMLQVCGGCSVDIDPQYVEAA
jgi:transcription antitermination factor NusG